MSNSSRGEMVNHLASKEVSVIARAEQALIDKEKIIYQPLIRIQNKYFKIR